MKNMGDALFTIVFLGSWVVGVAAASTVSKAAALFSLFPPIAWFYAAKWFMGIN